MQVPPQTIASENYTPNHGKWHMNIYSSFLQALVRYPPLPGFLYQNSPTLLNMRPLVLITLQLFNFQISTAFFYGQGYVKDDFSTLVLERSLTLDSRNLNTSLVCTVLNERLSGQVFFPGSNNYTIETTGCYSLPCHCTMSSIAEID
jgi:hypothetical protein